MKKLNVTMITKSVGNSSILVPDYLTLDEAIEYAKEHIRQIPTLRSSEHIDESEVLDEENCDFDEE